VFRDVPQDEGGGHVGLRVDQRRRGDFVFPPLDRLGESPWGIVLGKGARGKKRALPDPGAEALCALAVQEADDSCLSTITTAFEGC
jgi:hypothetical protein